MVNQGQYGNKTIRLKLYVVIAGALWTLAMGASFVWNWVEENHGMKQIARTHAGTTIEMDIFSRRWATMHGGVYAPITEKTQPNPYSEIPEREIRTPSGKELTLMNPHHMMRQIHELRSLELSVQGHMTSLKPINPKNAPDSWEEKALKLLEGKTVSEVSSIERMRGEPYMRMMKVLPTEQGCLKCHAKQGFKVGDIRGGVSVALPMKPLLAILRSHIFSLGVWHGIIWLLVLGGMGAVTLHLKRRIAKQRQAEEVLRESEQRYRSLFDRIPIGLYQTTAQGQIIDANPALVEMLGYPDRMSLLAINAADTYVNSEARARWQSVMGSEGVVLNYQKELRRYDGAMIWVNENTRAARDKEGHVLFYEGSFQDITERKRTEEALRKSEERYRTILDNIEEGYFEVDIAGNFTFFNDSMCRMLGYNRDKLMGMNDRQYMDKENAQKVYQAFNQVYTTEEPYRAFDWGIVRKDGTKRFVESSVSLLRDLNGERIGFRGVVRDITNRKFAEQALRRSEEEAKRLAQENAVMAEIGEVISSTLNVEEVYERFAEEVRKIIPFDRIVINIINIEKETVSNVYMAGKGIADRKVGEIYPLKGSGNLEMVRSDSSVLIQTEDFDEYKDRFPMLSSTFQAGFRSIMNVPLFSKGKIIGGLLLRSLKPYAYTDKDIRLAERVANQIAGAIANAQIFIERKRALEDGEQLILQLQKALAEVKQLSGLLPICASCKKIRDDKGYWNQIEEYIRDRSEAEFSHGICPECMKKLYPDV